jgi:hypothetical protein
MKISNLCVWSSPDLCYGCNTYNKLILQAFVLPSFLFQTKIHQSAVVITNCLTITKYPFLKCQWFFSLLRRFCFFSTNFLQDFSMINTRTMNCLPLASGWVHPSFCFVLIICWVFCVVFFFCCLSSFFVLFTMLSVSLDCIFCIVSSGFYHLLQHRWCNN